VPARIEEALASIAANIRKLRHSKGLTQEQLAEYSDLHLTYIQGIERGTRNISVGVLLTLANALKVPPYRLLRPAKLEPPKRGRPRKTRLKNSGP
jgi:transcriptional regulator with XRE-family HTH domain